MLPCSTLGIFWASDHALGPRVLLSRPRNDHVGAQRIFTFKHARRMRGLLSEWAHLSVSQTGTAANLGLYYDAIPHQRVGGDPSGPSGAAAPIGLIHNTTWCPRVVFVPRNSIQTLAPSSTVSIDYIS